MPLPENRHTLHTVQNCYAIDGSPCMDLASPSPVGGSSRMDHTSPSTRCRSEAKPSTGIRRQSVPAHQNHASLRMHSTCDQKAQPAGEVNENQANRPPPKDKIVQEGLHPNPGPPVAGNSSEKFKKRTLARTVSCYIPLTSPRCQGPRML